MTKTDKSWYAVYTKARWEKKVHERFSQQGIEAYCPLNRIKKKWSDRFKWIEEPLFKSYVFVKIGEEQQARVRMVAGVVNFVYWLGKPARISDAEIETIHRFLNEYADIEVLPLDIGANAKVRIKRGAFMDKEGRVMRLLNNKVQVVIESIGYRLVATLDKSNVAVVANRAVVAGKAVASKSVSTHS